MRKMILSLSAALLGIGLGSACALAILDPAPPSPATGPDLAPTQDPIVLVAPDHRVVVVYTNDGQSSAFPIGRDGATTIFLTAKHAVEGREWIYLGTREGRVPASRIETHPEADAALVWADLPTRGTYEMSLRPVEFGDPLRALGWVLGEHLVVQGGYAGAADVMSAQAFYGMSGGPVLDADGRVVGVVEGLLVLRSLPLPMCSFYEPLSEMETWLRDVGVID